MERVVLVKPSGEIALKSERVRRFFEKRLCRNLKATLRAAGVAFSRLERARGRLFLHAPDPCAAARAAQTVFGVHELAVARAAPAPSLEALAAAAAAWARKRLSPRETFAVRCTRSGEQAFTSRQACVAAGDAVRAAVPGARVDLSSPDKTLWIEARRGRAYLYDARLPGPGGLPVGVEGDVGLYVEGKARELAAALLLLRRGCRVHPVCRAPSKALQTHLSPLLAFNAGLPLKPVPEKALDTLIARQRLVALARADAAATPAAFARYRRQREKSPLPLLYPLLFQPRQKRARLLALQPAPPSP